MATEGEREDRSPNWSNGDGDGRLLVWEEVLRREREAAGEKWPGLVR